MDSPISYYGGKKRMVNIILPYILNNYNYIEPFFGGGAIFFAKKKVKNETINDLDNRVINFYEVLKNDFDKLFKLIDESLKSESLYQRSKIILQQNCKDKILMAWAFWYQTNFSFNHRIYGSFGFGKNGNRKIKNKKEQINSQLQNRIQDLEIFCRDAIDVIKIKDCENSFFYIDPPYVSADQGHYKGYTENNFIDLLDCLRNIKGKFLLSSYSEKILIEYINKFNWNFNTFKLNLSAMKDKTCKTKIEQLTYNYNIDCDLFSEV